MSPVRRWLRNLTAFQILVIGYGLVTLMGAVILSLPVSSQAGKHQPFIDSLFVATSGISTTGLAVVDIGSYYNTFGQIVLFCIFQIGGIGYMSFIMSFAHLLGLRLSFTTEIVAKESLSSPDYATIGRFFGIVLIFTLVLEIAGALILTLFWMHEFPLLKAAYLGIFHSVSAFCTAGFGLFNDSLMRYKTNAIVNYTIILVSIAGGIGFIVLYDIYSYLMKIIKNRYPRRLLVHTKIVVTTSLGIMLLGTVVILMAEKWSPSTGFIDRIKMSVFQAVSASTTDGFNTVDIGAMTSTSLTFIMVLMFVGASPGSTGGGIKTNFRASAGFCMASAQGRRRKHQPVQKKNPRQICLQSPGRIVLVPRHNNSRYGYTDCYGKSFLPANIIRNSFCSREYRPFYRYNTSLKFHWKSCFNNYNVHRSCRPAGNRFLFHRETGTAKL
jgi:trk system potassium uptake protein TrkH